ncbi:aminotransferase class I/II-fold pyridoxal phosphate-dependent enzyme [Lutibacter sp. TH_r2]|uniref:pyridoxal phosphate-dependent aminotransferase n=1 Tax=Lutibacter sp. TH_r2 TaxID=3082083 RepID=UPI0029536471|nr:aminotransferase class I/II-fold pyridoxal phosphate-dependent enzyme [Lutibacter sp. TH_r2]MDV7187776.1 aminotransferase class I/II-fold pyridoxal phosphate-dependent enzyme [Lutibacter sp. TH_r2]
MIAKADRLNQVQEYYFSKKLREIAALRAEGKPIINIAIGSPDLAPSQEVIKALTETTKLANAHQYQSYQGIPELREAISNFYQKQYNVALNPVNEILPLMGSKEGIMHISMAFLNKGDKVLVPNPGYPTYASVSNLVQAEIVNYNLNEANNWMPNYEELEKEDLANVKIMWVNYPHMPTGTVASKKDFEQLVAFAKKHNILIVNDNPYSFILNNNPISILEIEGAKDVAIELNSLSKTFNMAGWRVGMLVGNAEILKIVLQVKSNMDSGMFLGIQKGAIAALNCDDNWFIDLNKTYTKRRELVWQIFDALGCTYDTTTKGMFVWAKLPEGRKAIEFTDEILYNSNVFITPGVIFGSNGEGYIRSSLCVSEEVLKKVLDRILVKN